MKDSNIWRTWQVRYTLGVALIAVAANTINFEAKDAWMLTVFFCLCSLICMREIALLIIGMSILAGGAWAAIGIMAAIPVSVAIIIAALVIANK